MSEQEFELYLKLLSRCLGLTAAQREQIADELRDHLQERLEELAQSGVPRDKAVLQALDEFGDAAVLAGHFTTIARLKRRRFLMRLSLGSVAALAAAMLIAFAFWPENRAVQGPPQVVAQEKGKRVTPVPAKPSPAKPSEARTRADSTMPTVSPVVTAHPLSSDVGQNPRIEAALEANTDFSIEPEPLKDALEFIAQRYQIPILLDTKTLEDASIDTSWEVRLAVPGLKLRQMLTILLEQHPQPLGFDIQDGVLRISTIEKINEHMLVVVYDCRDLVHIRSIEVGGGVHHRAAQSSPGGGMFDVASAATEIARQFGGKGKADKGPQQTKADKGPQKTKEESGETAEVPRPTIPLIRVIQSATGPENWDEREREQPATITEFGGLLVVRQNPMVHEKIKRVLADIRRMKSDGAFSALDKDRNTPQFVAPQARPAAGF
jgi:hypothetical protein